MGGSSDHRLDSQPGPTPVTLRGGGTWGMGTNRVEGHPQLSQPDLKAWAKRTPGDKTRRPKAHGYVLSVEESTYIRLMMESGGLKLMEGG